MKIDGIDPLIMQKIQEQVRQKQVEESRRPAVENRTRGREKPPPWERGRSKRERNRLREEVRRLNETAKKLGLDLDFRLRFNPDRLLVYLHREDEETVVRELSLEQLPRVAEQLQRRGGVLLDQQG
ncbi:MAG: flagellar protein FlaG [Dethiobacteria bacterium]|nr:hypothetical protein [Bacillota bacterium]